MGGQGSGQRRQEGDFWELGMFYIKIRVLVTKMRSEYLFGRPLTKFVHVS